MYHIYLSQRDRIRGKEKVSALMEHSRVAGKYFEKKIATERVIKGKDCTFADG